MLSKLASMAFNHLTKEIIVEVLEASSTDRQEINAVLEEEGDNWMTPIIKLLEEGKWSGNPNEERMLRMKINQLAKRHAFWSLNEYRSDILYACMTRSSTKELFTPFKNPKQVLRSSRKLSKTRSLDYLNSPEFNLISNLKDQFEEEEIGAMAETIDEYMTKTRYDYGSGIARPKIDDKAHFELKGQFIKELCDNTFSGSDHEDANEHIEKVLEIVDLFNILK
ncbi:hypothetical protein Tco_0432426 [Tanacetum coccineum]